MSESTKESHNYLDRLLRYANQRASGKRVFDMAMVPIRES